MRHLTCLARVAALSAVMMPLAVSAQTVPPATSGLEITQMTSGFVAAPEVRFTAINDRSTTLVGGYAGWHSDGTLFIGGAGYFNTNRSRNFEFQTGGALVGWTLFRHNALAITPSLYAGLGSAQLTRPYGELFGGPDVRTTGPGPGPRMAAPTAAIVASTPVRIRDTFFVAEPRVNGSIDIRPWMRLTVGAGYRVIGDSRWLDNQLKGASGSIALQLGSK